MTLVLRRKLIIRCFTASAPRSILATACEDAAPCLTSAVAQPSCFRAFSMGPSYWDATTPARRELYSDLATAKQFLPNRSSFTTQFTPHGFQLIPESLPMAPPFEAQQHGLEDVAAAAAAALPNHGGSEGLQCDSVKRKRRLAMKKHKYKKRMRKLKGGSS